MSNHLNLFQDTSGISIFSSNSLYILDKSLYYNYWNDINLKPSFCNICFSANFNDIISNKPNSNSLSTLSNLYYSSNSFNSSFSNINYSTSNNLIIFNNNKLNNLNSSLWITSNSNIYSNLGSIGIGTSSFGNNKLSIKGNLKADDFKIKGTNLSNIIITSNIFDNKSNNLYNSVSNLDYNSKNKQITSSQFTSDSNKNLFINYLSNYSIYSNSFTSASLSSNLLTIPIKSQITFNYSNQYFINSGSYNILFENGNIITNYNSLITDKSYPILKDTSGNNINPVTWYKFDNSSNNMIFESSLNSSSNLILYNNPSFDNVNFIKGNGSIYFNNPSTASTQIYSVIPNNVLPASYLNSLNLTNGLSFSFWINLNSSSIDYCRILYFGNFQSVSPYYDNTNYRFQIRTSSPKTSAIYFDIVKDGFYTFQYNSNMFDNTWKHIIWTISSTGIWNIYINNILVCNNQSKIVFPLLSSTNLIYILGVDKHPSNYGIIGNIDDFRIYSSVLTSNQVGELYNGRIDLLQQGISYGINAYITGTGNTINILNDNNNYRYALFISNGTFVIDTNITCDILIVGGGGGGGVFGGGGGAGAVLYRTNLILSSGTYSIVVGSGGVGSTGTSINGTNGNNSSITINSTTYIAVGGGGGGTRNDPNSYTGRGGNNGGSGGGGSHSDNSTTINTGGISTKNTYTNWISLGNSGGEGKDGTSGGYGSGGGGGAGSIGANAGTNSGGNGGTGVNLSSIFGTAVGHSGWFGGGGGGGSFTGVSGQVGYGNGGNGLLGGGGNAYSGNGIDYTGGGGGGANVNGNGNGGNGGSGVVIIRYLYSSSTIISNSNSLALSSNSIVKFNYSNDTNINTGIYNVYFSSGSITINSNFIIDKSYPILKDISGNNINPTAWYKFDDTTNLGKDEMNVYNLINYNSVAYNSTNFIKGTGSSSFNSANSRYLLGSAVNINNKSFSISFWVYPTNLNNTFIYSKLNGSPGSRTALHIGYRTSTNFTFAFWGDDLEISVSNHLNNWNFFTLTYNMSNNEQKAYINSVFITSRITGGSLNSSDQNYNIGRSFGGSDYFSGLLDDFRIYSGIVLTQTQINELYNGRVYIFSSNIYSSNVGIGTNSISDDILTIAGNLNVNDFSIKRTSSSNLLITSNYQDISSNNLISFFNLRYSTFNSSNWITSNSSIYFSSNGNIGLGSTIPKEKLDIFGNLNVNGKILPNSCNSFDIGSSNRKFKDLYLSGYSIFLNDFSIKNSNNYLSTSNINVNQITFKNNTNGNSKTISLNTNGDFMVSNKYILTIDDRFQLSNIVFSNVFNNSSNFLSNLNFSKYNSIKTIDNIPTGTSNRFIINDIYNRPITFSGILQSSNLITSNLNVIGDYTIFNTTIYQSEQLFINNSCNYTPMIVKQVNINKNVAEFYTSNLITTDVSISGTGNTINTATDNINYKYAFFSSNGTFILNQDITCDILIVGGGGSGGGYSGGGGGGDVIYKSNYILKSGTYNIIIGNGGIAPRSGSDNYINGNSGETSSITSTNLNFIPIYAAGGGGGIGYNKSTPTITPTAGSIIDGNYSSGGGGGAGSDSKNYSSGTGNSVSGNGGKSVGIYGSGGGGGATGNGGDATSATNTAGIGGTGFTSIITGTSLGYGGGGGGSSWTAPNANSGTDGGGNGGRDGTSSATNGLTNRGGGGGGAPTGYNGGNGGSGVVIIRYAIKNMNEQIRFIVNSNGNVGIGTINPSSKLNVIGTINSTGLILNNNQIINQIKTNDSNYSNSIFNSWNYSNNLYLNSSNFFSNINNFEQDLLNSSTILLGIGSNIINPNYSNVINKADLSIYSTSVNSTSNSLYSNLSNNEYYSSNSNINYINNSINNLIKFQWNTNGINVFTNSNVGIGSTIPSINLDINGNLNANELLIKKGNISNILITSNIFDNRSNNFYSSFSNKDFISSNSNINYTNIILNNFVGNNNSDIWKKGNNLLTSLDFFNSINSTCNSYILYSNSLTKINYTNNTYINSGTYNIIINNGLININSNIITNKSYPILKDNSGNTINPTAWYKFDDNTNIGLDSSGNNYNLTNNSSVSLDNINFIKGTSCSLFNGINNLQRAYTGNLFSDQSGWSISFWIYLKKPSNLVSLISTRLTDSSTLRGFNWYFDSSGNINFQVGNDLSFTWYGGTYGVNNFYSDSINFKWFHFVLTMKSGEQRFYSNGVLLSSGSESQIPNFQNGSSTFTIGSSSTYGYYVENGFRYDDVRYYGGGRILTSNQVRELYNGRVDFFQTGNLLGYGSNVSITGTNNTINIANDNSNYRYAFFANSGTFTIDSNLTCDILVVGGGGGGGITIGSGGGAGGVVYVTNYNLNAGSYTIIVGSGGAPMQNYTDVSTANGGNSIFRDSNNNDIITALGGAIGSSQSSTFSGTPPKSGGSGAGGTRNGITGGSGTQKTNLSISAISRTNGYGNAGGNGTNTAPWPAGGGGGAGSAGGIGSGTIAGNGGIGIQINITGTNTYYAGGGGGGGYNDGTYINTVAGTGGLGGGGNGSLGAAAASSGTANTGGGGGGQGGAGSGYGTGGTGGTGVVIIRYLYSSPSITTNSNSLILSSNSVVKFNYINDTNINLGNYNIDFSSGSITINSNFTYDYSYPILKDSSDDNINPIAWYKFDLSNNLGKDEMNVYNLTNNNTIIDISKFTKGIGSVNFNSVGYFNVSTSLLNNLNLYTISFWLYLNSLNNYFITSKQHDGNNTYAALSIGCYTNGAFVSGTAGKIYYHSKNNVIEASSINNLLINNWYLINIVATSSNCLIYINGVLDNTVNGDFSIPNVTSVTNSHIGRWFSDGSLKGTLINGNIDDFRIYNLVLTSNQIKELYNGRIDIFSSNNTNIIYNNNNNINYLDNVFSLGTGSLTNTITSTTNSLILSENSIIKFNYNNQNNINSGTYNINFNNGIINFNDTSFIKPWGAYFADDWSGTNLLDSSGNNRHAITSGTITKIIDNGFGASAFITSINGGTSSTISWPSGSIPSNFTILSLTRYTGGKRSRILTADTNINFIHGHHENKRGVVYYDGWKTNATSIGNLDDWVCTIGKNGGTISNNILIDGIQSGIATGGTGNSILYINLGRESSERSDWALSCVIIYDSILSDAYMVKLNNFINIYKTTGDLSQLKINIISINDYSYPILKDISSNNVNPIVWYKFDGSSSFLNDTFNSSNIIINNGSTYDNTNFIKGNGSIKFIASSSQYATIPNNFNLNSINSLNGISFSWWSKNNSSTGNWGRIFDFGNKTADNNGGCRYIMVGRYGSETNINFQITNPTEFNYGYLSNFIYFTTGANYFDGIWRHYVWTITSTGVWNIYVNNSKILDNSQKIAIPSMSGTIYNYLGKSLYSADGYYDGNIDDFRIYNFILTSTQVQELYKGRIEFYSLNSNNLNTTLSISQSLGSLTNSITSTCNSLVLSGNSLAKINYTNNININSGTYDINVNGGIGIGESPYVRPWGAYFADDWSGTNLIDSSGNRRDTISSSGTISKTTATGNGATASITYISGGTGATISWPTGSIPTDFTILSLTRYNGGTNGRILCSYGSGNWLHGHWNGNRGVCHYNNGFNNTGYTTNLNNWVCTIGKNNGVNPGNILIDGSAIGVANAGYGNLNLGINNGIYGDNSDWALNCVIIYDSILSDAHMVKLNNFINTYKTNGNLSELKSNILRNIDNSYPILKDINGNNINPTAWYKFDDSTNLGLDSSGNNYHLTNNNNVSIVKGIKGDYASSFNKTNTLSTTNGINLSGNSFSISFWQFAKSNFNSFTSSFGDNLSLIGNKSIMVGYGTNLTNKYFFGFWGNDFYSSEYPNDVNNWIYMTFTYNSSTKIRKVYRNSIYIGGDTSPTQLAMDGTTINIGSIKNVAGYSTNGYYDDFRIYNNIELTQTQISELYNGRIDIYNYISTSNFSSNIVVRGNLNLNGNIKFNNTSLNLVRYNFNPVSITGTNNTINIANDNIYYKYIYFASNGTLTINSNMICDILIVGGGGGGGARHAGGGGGGAVIYLTNELLNAGTYTITIGNGGSSNTSYGQGGIGGDTIITYNSSNKYLAKGGGAGYHGVGTGNSNKDGGSGGGGGEISGLSVNTNIPSGTYGNNGGISIGGSAESYFGGGGGGGAYSSGYNAILNGTLAIAGNGGSGRKINITGTNLYFGGGGGGGCASTAQSAGTGGIGGGGNGSYGTATASSGTNNTGGGGGGSGFNGGPNGISGSGGSGVVIIRYYIYQDYFNGFINYSNIQNRPYLLDLLTSSNIINVRENNNLNFPLSTTSWKNEWFLYIGTSPTNISNSFIFHHLTSTINSKWWFNGTTTSTNAEISDERIKKEIQDIPNGLDKLMLINPKEYRLCDDKDYHKKYGIVAQDIYQIPELNHLVYKDDDYIANIYSLGSYDNSSGMFIINSLKNINELIDLNDEIKILLDNNKDIHQEIIIEELPYQNRYKKRFVKVKRIIDDYSFEIFDDIELTNIDKTNLFIYGKKINDFHKLDYNSLYTLNIKANQEIYDIIKNNYNTLDNLTTRIKNLENKLL